MALLPLNPAI